MAPDANGARRLRGGAPGRRAAVLLGLVVLALLALAVLDTPASGLVPSASGVEVAKRFLGTALRPALDYQEAHPDFEPFLWKVAKGAWRTVLLAAGGMSLALVFGAVLGVFSSDAWWEDRGGRGARRAARGSVQAALRLVIALMRSVHELLWAVLFLAAFGLTPFAAALAIAIPYGGTLAKVFAEMVDEEPRAAAHALRAMGASRASEYVLGLVPGAMSNVIAYAFYRFECSLRSAAVMGFFGIPTLGYDLQLAWNDLAYREVWTYVYAMTALVLLFEAWSAGLRKRFVA
ncbi:MAG: ABC transporter permease subunit [Planctomycetota bacterium]